MKRILFGLLVLFPGVLYSQTMNARIRLGFFPHSEMLGSWHNSTNYFSTGDKAADMVGTGANRFDTMEVAAEFGLNVSPNFGFAVGLGHMNLGLKKSSETFTHPAGSDIFGDFFYSPKYKSYLYNTYASAIFIWPWKDNINLNLFAGAGYYIGSIQCYDSQWTKASPVWSDQFSYAPWIMESKVSTIGYHVGVGLEIQVGDRTFLVLDGIYRKIEFTEFSTEPLLGNQSEWDQIVAADSCGLAGESTFVYAQLVRGDEKLGDIMFNGQSLKLPSLGFHLGLKFFF